MKRTIAAALVLVCLGAQSQAPSVQARTALSAPGGRFVFGQVSDFRRDQYMLDTQTGRLWKIVLRKAKNADGTDAPGDGFEVLDWVPYVMEGDGKLSVVPR